MAMNRLNRRGWRARTGLFSLGRSAGKRARAENQEPVIAGKVANHSGAFMRRADLAAVARGEK